MVCALQGHLQLPATQQPAAFGGTCMRAWEPSCMHARARHANHGACLGDLHEEACLGHVRTEDLIFGLAVPRLQLYDDSPPLALARHTLSSKYERIGTGSQLLSVQHRVRRRRVSQERARTSEQGGVQAACVRAVKQTLDNRKEQPSRQMVSEDVLRHIAANSPRRRWSICSLLSVFPAPPGAALDAACILPAGRAGAGAVTAERARVRRDGGCAGAGAATAERARVRRDGGDGISRISTEDEDELEETRVTPA